jgi:hypothetical protein
MDLGGKAYGNVRWAEMARGRIRVLDICYRSRISHCYQKVLLNNYFQKGVLSHSNTSKLQALTLRFLGEPIPYIPNNNSHSFPLHN